jgi:hypothetical protein
MVLLRVIFAGKIFEDREDAYRLAKGKVHFSVPSFVPETASTFFHEECWKKVALERKKGRGQATTPLREQRGEFWANCSPKLIRPIDFAERQHAKDSCRISSLVRDFFMHPSGVRGHGQSWKEREPDSSSGPPVRRKLDSYRPEELEHHRGWIAGLQPPVLLPYLWS